MPAVFFYALKVSLSAQFPSANWATINSEHSVGVLSVGVVERNCVFVKFDSCVRILVVAFEKVCSMPIDVVAVRTVFLFFFLVVLSRFLELDISL